VGVVTNITHEHLDYHKSYEHYRASKARLFTMLAESAAKPGGPPKAAVLNADDASLPYLASLVTVPAYRYSLHAEADVTAGPVTNTPAGLRFTARAGQAEIPVATSLVGAFNVSNCLAAIGATVCALGVPPEAAQRGIASLAGVPGRMERLDLGQPFTAIVRSE